MRNIDITTSQKADELRENQDLSWRSLYKIGAVLLPLAGLSFVASQAVQWVLNAYPSVGSSSGPAGLSNFVDTLDFIGANANIFNLEYSLFTLGALAFIPAVLALAVRLSKVDKGVSAVGAAFALTGTGLVLLNAVTAFEEIQEASAWNSGCTTCGTYPIYAAAGAGFGSEANQIGFLVVVLAIALFSYLMLRGTDFGRISGLFGLSVAIVTVIAGFVSSSLSDTAYDIVSVSPFVLYTIWALTVTPRLRKL
ncbi:MAG TPA: DUF4386 family protein [Candidatus Acidoferrales bacterium]|nr:DUF4386 family protein [Candidatus Acidoferrales bacterium]